MVFLFSAVRKRVVLTGFSPFQGGKINPSWEGMKLMNGRKIEVKHDITLFRKEIAVNYDKVDTEMWYFYQPHLTIHVGINEAVESFVLEKMANIDDYDIPDNDNKLPEKHLDAGPDVVSTTLDVERICHKFNNCNDSTLRAKASDDAGKYLSEYIYYISLSRVTRSPTLFVHVPFDKYTSKQLAYGLERILELCLEQLSKDEDDDDNDSNTQYSDYCHCTV